MKKKVFSLIAGASVACCVVCLAFFANGLNKPQKSDLLLEANIEALTNDETRPVYKDCYPVVVDCPASKVVYCGICDYVSGPAEDLWDLRKCIKK